MRIMTKLILLVFLLSAISMGGGESKVENEYVKVNFNLSQREFKPGSTGRLSISFKPKSGYHIVLTPPLEVRFDSGTGVVASGKPDILQSGKKDYLDPSKPIKQAFTLASKLKTGPATVKGTLIYFYCSDVEGWCSKFKQPFELSVKLVK